MADDVLQYLESHGVHLRRAAGWEYHAACLFCDEDPSSRGRLYVNVDPQAEVPGLHFCHRCGAKGSLTALKRHFGDEVTEIEQDSQVRWEILSAAASWYHDQLGAVEAANSYLHGRGLTDMTIKAHQLGYAPMEYEWDLADQSQTTRRPRRLYGHLRDEGFTSKDIIATGLCHEQGGRILDTLYGMVTIPYRTAGNVTMIRGRTWPYTEEDFDAWPLLAHAPSKAKYKTCGGNQARLFNSDVTWSADEVFITEGEFDALILEQEGYAAIGVPGAKAWQDAWNGYLSTTKRVWLVFDRDRAGEEGAQRLIDKFGPKVRPIHLSPEGIKCDPTDWFREHSREEFDELVSGARRGGLLIDVRQAIAEFEAVQDKPGLKFGFELLDLMIEPGLQSSQVMILLAKTGTGKTMWLLNMMHRMRTAPGQEDLKILFVSLEQTRGEWWDRARRIFRFYRLDDSDEDAALWWQDNLMLVDKNRVSEAEMRQILDDFECHMGAYPDCVFLDYLGYWANSFKGERYERTSDAVHSLKAIAKDYHVPFVVPHQVSRVGRDGEEFASDAARDSGVIEETADFLLTIWSPDNTLARQEEEKTGQLHLRIAKSRHGGRGVLLSMQWAPVSLAMVPQGDPLCARARQEFAWRNLYRDNWEKVLYRHRTGFEGHLEHVPGAALAELDHTRRFP